MKTGVLWLAFFFASVTLCLAGLIYVAVEALL